MPKITWLGDVDNPGTTENDVYCTWGAYQFPAGVPVEVDDPHILRKARTNRFFRVEEPSPAPDEPASGRVDYAADAGAYAFTGSPATFKRSHKKKVDP